MAEQHFCLIKLAESRRAMLDFCGHFPEARERYLKAAGSGKKSEADSLALMRRLVSSLRQNFLSVISALRELEEEEESRTARKLFEGIRRFDFLNGDPAKLCAALTAFAESLPESEQNLNTQALRRLMNRVKMGYFPTELNHVDFIKRAVTFPEKQVNLLDPCSGCGLALARLAADENAVTYGVELDDFRAQESEKRLSRVAYGSFFHSRISHEAFHCVFLNPPYLSVMTEGGGSARSEKTFLAGALPHLMNGGLLIYIVPYYRATADVCRVLCDNFDDLMAWRFEGSEFKKFKQVAIFGVKRTRADSGSLAEKFEGQFLDPEQIPPLSEIPAGRYALPDVQKNVALFKGAVFNIRELERQLAESGTVSRLFDSSRLERTEKRPPLPLNIGQIGLVGGSGLMNGLVECEHPHVIKGRVVRQYKSEIIGDGEDCTELREVSTNRMIFNLLTPDGVKSLS